VNSSGQKYKKSDRLDTMRKLLQKNQVYESKCAHKAKMLDKVIEVLAREDLCAESKLEKLGKIVDLTGGICEQ
jgi:hypothetical protein